MSTSPRNDFSRPKLCCFSCTLKTSTAPKILLPGAVFLGGLAKPLSWFLNFSWVYALGNLFTSYFKCGQNWCRISTQKAVLVMEKTKHIWQNPWGNFPNFFIGVHTVVPHLYSRFSLTLFRFGGVIIKKPFRNPQSDFNMASSSLYLIQCVFLFDEIAMFCLYFCNVLWLIGIYSFNTDGQYCCCLWC